MSSEAPADIIAYHRFLIGDKGRTGAYQQAIAQAVRPGDIVLDIGTGTGILSFLACKAGARKVYAVEAGGVIEIARRVCRKNGFQDRVEFFEDLSHNVQLPERADILLNDIGGPFGVDAGVLGSVIDARKRLLKENAKILPGTVELFLAPVEFPEGYGNVDFWSDDLYSIDFSSVRRVAANNLYSADLNANGFLADPVSVAHISLYDVEDSYLHIDASFSANRDGVLYGLGGWCSFDVFEGLRLLNGPVGRTVGWANTFFPIETPLPVEKGACVRASIQTNDGRGAWQWRVECETSGGSGETRTVCINHSTPSGSLISAEALHKRSSIYAPKLSRKGEAEAFVLSLFAGDKTIEQIERLLGVEYADCFRSSHEASSFVRDLVARCA